MIYKPRSTRDIYMDSLSINSEILGRQLVDQNGSLGEVKSISDFVGKNYRKNLDTIIRECKKDMMALERVPSPLILFVDCLARSKKSTNLSLPAWALLLRYASAWEE